MMNKTKASISSRTMILLIGAVLLCAIGLTGAVGATQASLNYSEDYAARIEQSDLGVALFEKSGSGEVVAVNIGDEGKHTGTDSVAQGLEATLLAQKSGDELLILDGDKQMIPGKKYTEEISAKNVADLPQYLRITVKKYWTVDGKKAPELNPALIKLGMNSAYWKCIEDPNGETVTFYYLAPVNAGQLTANAVEQIWLDPAIVDHTNDLKDYLADKDLADKELKLNLEAQVEAVQTNHVVDAAKSAWGVDINALDLGWQDIDTSTNGQEA